MALRRDRRLKQADIVAEGFAEPAGFEKIALHVNDDQRGTVDVQSNRLRFGGDGDAVAIPFTQTLPPGRGAFCIRKSKRRASAVRGWARGGNSKGSAKG